MIALVQFALVLFAIAKKYRLALMLFVFFLAFSPRSASLALGGEGFALTFQRMSILILLAYLFTAYAFKITIRKRIYKVVSEGPIALLLFLIILVKMFATLIGGKLLDFVYIIDDSALSLGVFLIFACYIRTARDYYLILFVIVASVLLTAALGLIELQIGHPLIASLVDVKVQINESVLIGRVRNEGYRLQAMFDNPLALAELAVYSLPISLFGLAVFSGRRKILFFAIGAFCSLFLIHETDARSGILAALAIILVYPTVYYWPKLSMITRFAASFILLCLLLYAAVIAFDFVLTKGLEAEGVDYWRYDQTERSTMSRARQYFEVIKVLEGTNFIGVGFRQNYANEIEDINRLDSYYLRLLLEGGLAVLFLFVLLLLMSIKVVRSTEKVVTGRVGRHVHAMLVSFIVGFSIMKLFVSMPANNVYFFLMMGSYWGYVCGARSTKLGHRTPCSDVRGQ